MLDDGQIAVDTADEGDVTLILNGVDITSSSSAAINVIAAKDVILVLAASSTNLVADGENYVFPDATTDKPNAAVFSKADLTISGEGVLSVTGSYNDGIASKDELVIESGSIIVTAVDDGIRGKDSVVVGDGNITVTAGSGGMAQATSTSSSQNSVLINFATAQAAGTLVHIEDSAGNAVLTFAPTKDFRRSSSCRRTSRRGRRTTSTPAAARLAASATACTRAGPTRPAT